jgi:hypothetical protein
VIVGANFTDVVNVRVAGNLATFSQINSTTLNIVTPAGAVKGLADVSVLTAFGVATSHGGFTYN